MGIPVWLISLFRWLSINSLIWSTSFFVASSEESPVIRFKFVDGFKNSLLSKSNDESPLNHEMTVDRLISLKCLIQHLHRWNGLMDKLLIFSFVFWNAIIIWLVDWGNGWVQVPLLVYRYLLLWFHLNFYLVKPPLIVF